MLNGHFHRTRSIRGLVPGLRWLGTNTRIEFGGIGLVGALTLFLALSCVRPSSFFVEFLGKSIVPASKPKFQVRATGGQTQDGFVADSRGAGNGPAVND